MKRSLRVPGRGGHEPNDTDILISLAESAELFHAPDKTGFADILVDGHRETWPIHSKGFRWWWLRRYFEEEEGAPNSESVKAALNLIEANAHFDGPERIVYLRVGEHAGKYYLDLCNDTWQAIEIDTEGWRVVDNPPVRFRRSAGMQPLPTPLRGGSIKKLKRFLNVKSDYDFVLVVAFLLAALRPRGPYPVPLVNGEQGSAKSTFIRILKCLVDPNAAALRALPREDRDLFIAAYNSYILAFDNVSGLKPWISDTFCRLSTGGSFAVRQLYTDQDEVLFDAVRPVMLNGIEEVVDKPDLADRSLFFTLEPIPEEKRKTEEEFWVDFETVRPSILGALLDGVVEGLTKLPQTRLKKLPRMADFALWVTACETAFWRAGIFETAYWGNRSVAVEVVLESDSVAVAVRSFIAERNEWEGSATELLAALGAEVGETQKKSKEWPTSARALSGRLRRAATFLRNVGVEIAFTHAGTRKIHISSGADNGGTQPSVSSAPSTSPPKSKADNGFAPHAARTMLNDSDDSDDGADPERADNIEFVRANPLRNNEMDGTDAVDAKLPQESAAATLDPDNEEMEWSSTGYE